MGDLLTGPAVEPASRLGLEADHGLVGRARRRCGQGSAADGVHVLSFAQAQAAAREWFAQQARIVAGLEAVPAGPYLVRDVIADYLGWYALHRKGLGATTAMANRHILPALGGMEATRLTAGAIREWHDRLALSPRGRRGKSAPPAEEHGQTSPRTAEATRARRVTANRVLTVLKAALNHAYAEGKVASDDGWRRVQSFRGADAARIGYLDEGACRRLVNACPEGFRQLVRGALESGWVAAEVLGHSDTRMVERHYGNLAKGLVRAEVERTGLRLGDATDDNIVRLGERYSARKG